CSSDLEEEDSHLGDFIEDSDAVVPIDAASFILLQEQLEAVLHTLSERKKKVIQLRFGLHDGMPRTLEEVGREFGVTRERIRQIESKTLSKLRHPSRSQKLRAFLESLPWSGTSWPTSASPACRHGCGSRSSCAT